MPLRWIIATGLFIAFAIFAAVRIYWTDIVAQPPSAAAFLGALAGAGGGLLAIILGALLNAELNRRRDDRLRELERIALTNALASEMTNICKWARAQIERLRTPTPATVRAVTVGRPASARILEGSVNRLGLLDSSVLAALIEANEQREVLCRFLEEMRVDTPDLDVKLSDESVEIIIRRYDNLAQASKKAADALKASIPKL